ncbi:hypothetical protein OAC89_04625 [Deltaproteobacteria bacterium]|nr:hypothetical protein [Deltaproteobacteria bacterium]
MEKMDAEKDVKGKRMLIHSEGVTYFSKKTERTFFFILTIIMLVWIIFIRFLFQS